MRTAVLIIAMALCIAEVSAQKIKWEATSYNFGTVRDWDSPPATFRFTNTGKSKLMFLPRHYGRDVQVVFPARSIAPGETAEVTVHFYTPDTGPFSKNVEVWSNASDRPQTLSIRGNIASLRNNALTACPTFQNDMPAGSSGVNILTVVDRSTGEQIAGARVEFFRKKQSRAVYETDQRGLVRSKLENGPYTVQAEMTGYFPTVQDITFERRQGSVIVFMEPMKSAMVSENRKPRTENFPVNVDLGLNLNDQWEEENRRSETENIPINEDLGLNVNDQWGEEIGKSKVENRPAELDLGLNVNDQWEEENGKSKMENRPADVDLGLNVNDQWDEVATVPDATPPSSVPPAHQLPSSSEEDLVEAALAALEPKAEFSEEEYLPNNIVLLLDVSSSMRKNGKLDLLKGSATRMVEMMREVDRLTVLAFNMIVWTVVNPTPVTDHGRIIANINGLEAEGYTSGVKGMKEAYAQLTDNWVEGGNNQLILVTDGMFNSSSFTEKDAVNLAAEYAKRGIILSVVGYSEDRAAEKMMKRIARRGNGSYLQVDGADDPVGVLAEEIKLRSRRL